MNRCPWTGRSSGYRENDIVHENPQAWVLRDRKQRRYTVFVKGSVASESDSAYPLTPDGLSIAVARADHLFARRVEAAKRGAALDLA